MESNLIIQFRPSLEIFAICWLINWIINTYIAKADNYPTIFVSFSTYVKRKMSDFCVRTVKITQMITYLGLDLGGTKLLVGEISSDGVVLNHKRYDSGYLGQEKALDFIQESVDDYIATVGWRQGGPEAIGVGMIGRVDSTNGVWYQIDSNRCVELEIAKVLSHRYGLPCYADNDVKSATKAEMLWGIGKISSNFIYLNIGTGIASGAVIEGKLLKGASFNAGETGHMVSGVRLGLRCCCGREDCVELIASGSGIDASARALCGRYRTELTIPEIPQRVDVRKVVSLAASGDELCGVLIENAAQAAAGLIMDLVRCYDPDTIVLGGGIVSDDSVFNRIIEHIDTYTIRFVKNGIVRTSLNPNFAGLLGAAANALVK